MHVQVYFACARPGTATGAEITNIVCGAAAAADIVYTLKVHLYTTPRLFCATTRCVLLPLCERIYYYIYVYINIYICAYERVNPCTYGKQARDCAILILRAARRPATRPRRDFSWKRNSKLQCLRREDIVCTQVHSRNINNSVHAQHFLAAMKNSADPWKRKVQRAQNANDMAAFPSAHDLYVYFISYLEQAFKRRLCIIIGNSLSSLHATDAFLGISQCQWRRLFQSVVAQWNTAGCYANKAHNCESSGVSDDKRDVTDRKFSPRVTLRCRYAPKCKLAQAEPKSLYMVQNCF